MTSQPWQTIILQKRKWYAPLHRQVGTQISWGLLIVHHSNKGACPFGPNVLIFMRLRKNNKYKG